jgi:hypothetical protein
LRSTLNAIAPNQEKAFSKSFYKHCITRAGCRRNASSDNTITYSPAPSRAIPSRMSEANSMSFIERSSFTKSPVRIPAPSEDLLLAVIAVAFLFLHIAGGIIVQSSLPADSTATSHEATPSYYD